METKETRFIVEPEQDSYFDVYGWGCGCDCKSTYRNPCEHDLETLRVLDSQGLWWVAKEVGSTCDLGHQHWEVVDSLGMVFGGQIEVTKKEMGDM
jgi:hypothetical protein